MIYFQVIQEKEEGDKTLLQEMTCCFLNLNAYSMLGAFAAPYMLEEFCVVSLVLRSAYGQLNRFHVHCTLFSYLFVHTENPVIVCMYLLICMYVRMEKREREKQRD